MWLRSVTVTIALLSNVSDLVCVCEGVFKNEIYYRSASFTSDGLAACLSALDSLTERNEIHTEGERDGERQAGWET